MLSYKYMSYYMELRMKPFGYYLIHIHESMERGFARLLTDEDLTRRHWQVLNTLAAGPHGQAEINAALKPFGDDFGQQVHDLASRGWVHGEYELTTVGHAAYQRVSQRVHAFRAQVTAGISDEEYAVLVNLLDRVATNAAALV